jgi:hypothetical protein
MDSHHLQFQVYIVAIETGLSCEVTLWMISGNALSNPKALGGHPLDGIFAVSQYVSQRFVYRLTRARGFEVTRTSMKRLSA